MKVKTIKSFYDKQEKKHRSVGDVFDCTAARMKEINSTGAGALVEKQASTKKTEEETTEEETEE